MANLTGEAKGEGCQKRSSSRDFSVLIEPMLSATTNLIVLVHVVLINTPNRDHRELEW